MGKFSSLKMKPYIIILYLFILVALGATADGLNTYVQTWGHLFEAIEIPMLFFACILFVKTWRSALWLFFVYVLLRIAFFDFAYNISAGNELFYFGGQNWWDMFWSKQVPYTRLYPSIGSFIVAVFITIRKL